VAGFQIRFEAPLTQPQVYKLRANLMVWLEEQGFPADTSYRVATVVDELFCNTMEYSGAHWTEVRADTHGSGIQLDFRDDGVAFDPFESGRRDYTLYLNSDTDRRLGLYLVNRIATDVAYRREGEVNTVTFVVPAEPPDPMKRLRPRDKQ
jgi:anti-sigma regulatory factor (Ser/Thr protein kinase)